MATAELLIAKGADIEAKDTVFMLKGRHRNAFGCYKEYNHGVFAFARYGSGVALP